MKLSRARIWMDDDYELFTNCMMLSLAGSMDSESVEYYLELFEQNESKLKQYEDYEALYMLYEEACEYV